jgi:hypothetical protein
VETWVYFDGNPRGVCGAQSGTWQVLPEHFGFILPIIIPPVVLHTHHHHHPHHLGLFNMFILNLDLTPPNFSNIVDLQLI